MIRLDLQVPDERVNEVLELVSEVTGEAAWLEESLFETRDHRPETGTVVIFHASELRELTEGINRALDQQGASQRLDHEAELTPGQMRDLLGFACSLEWNYYHVAGGLPENWADQVGEAPLRPCAE